MISFTLLSFFLIFCVLVVASLVDLKTREVPDYLSFSLIAVGFVFALLASFITLDYSYFVSSLLGFGVCFLFACLMFYTGQWGGGDAKLLMGIGALLGLPLSFFTSFSSFLFVESIRELVSSLPFLILFVPLILVLGGVYGFVWLLVLMIMHWKPFVRYLAEAHAQKKHTQVRYIMFGVIVLCLIAAFFSSDFFLQLLCFTLAALLLVLYYGFLTLSAIEHVALIKKVPVSQVTEGDWVAHNVVVDGKKIVSKRDLGISDTRLALLRKLAKQGKITHVAVRYGIPFVPSFLFAFLVTIALQYLL